MNIVEIRENKSDFLNILLIGDEQESMINRYLPSGALFVLYEDDLRAACVVNDNGGGVCELKNISVLAAHQRNGYGKKLLQYVCAYYKNQYKTMLVGTGDVEQVLSFYKNCGFVYSHTVKDFFSDNYDVPIINNGIILKDMLYLKKDL